VRVTITRAKGKTVAFDATAFVSDVQSAAATADSIGAVQEVVASAIVDGAAIDSALGTEQKPEHETLLSSAHLTIQRIIWPAGLRGRPHEHRMWAVVGVYAGEELNRIYERGTEGLRQTGTRAVPERDVIVLDADAIHSVENPNRNWTAGLHVYGGDIVNIERSAWGPDGREVPFAENVRAARATFQSMGELAKEHGLRLDDEARYLAFTALRAATERERRYLTPAEARQIIAGAWRLEAE
jgi:predicted metal-dependent enzyme (double-stranded beta helix superfamily)